MTDRFVAIGECMVEMAPQPGGLYAMGFAGDTLNTAWYARRCLPGWQVDYVTAVGTDAVSDRMMGFLADAGIGTAQVHRRADRTVGLYLIELTKGERSFAYWRGQSAARTLADDPATLAAAVRGARVVYFSGITLAILEPAARGRLLAVLADARAAGATVAFDPNLRPRLWAGADAMRDGIKQGAAVADIALPSFEDEAGVFGDATPRATADRYAAAGARVVAVKNGAAEMLCLAAGAEVRVTPPPVAEVVDTTAAGDSFNAGFLAAWMAGAGARDALLAGAALAGRVIGARGALVAV